VAAECFEINLNTSDRTRRHAAIAESGCLDEVLGIPARTFMEPHLRERVTGFAERQLPFGILLIQVDEMDHLRATRGPGVVPAVLRVAARTIENSLRTTDLVGCWSEHQFLVVLMECRETEVERVAQRIMKMIRQSEIEWWGDTISVTAAIGGAGSRPGDTLELLVGRAGKSLLRSVASGGNRVTVLG
jgi:diguanylate cyclase